jgi:hypothetical protein
LIYFVLTLPVIFLFLFQNDINRKPQGEICIDELCRITRAEGAATFEIATEKKTYYLTADSIAATEDWVRVLQVIVLSTMDFLVIISSFFCC